MRNRIGRKDFLTLWWELGWKSQCLFLLIVSHTFCGWVDLFKVSGSVCIYAVLYAVSHKTLSQGGFRVQEAPQSRVISEQALLCLVYVFQTPERAQKSSAILNPFLFSLSSISLMRCSSSGLIFPKPPRKTPPLNSASQAPYASLSFPFSRFCTSNSKELVC